MAGSELYIGKILDDFALKMNDMANKVDSMSTKMNENVDILSAVSLNTSQAISTLNVKSSWNAKGSYPSVAVDKSAGGAYYNMTKYVDLLVFRSFVNGSIYLTIDCVDTITRANVDSADTFSLVVVNDGVEYLFATGSSTSGTPTGTNVVLNNTIGILVNAGDKLEIQLKVTSAASKNSNYHSIHFASHCMVIYYDLLQVVTDGGMVLL